MIYLVAIIFAAVRVGRGPSVLAAALSVAAYDFFFVPPRYTFAVSDTRHVLTFAMMFAVGITLSELTVRVRTQAREARHRESVTAALYALARDLGAAADAGSVAASLAKRAADAFDGTVAVLVADPDGALREVARSGEAVLDARIGASHVGRRRTAVPPAGSDTLPGRAPRAFRFPRTAAFLG
jgi:two-component system sensor histidine kinase KdpD